MAYRPHGTHPCERLFISVRGAVRVVPPSKGATPVDVNRILSELRTERELLVDAIMHLERLARGRGKRRGRPPKWMTKGSEQTKRGSGRPRKRQPEGYYD